MDLGELSTSRRAGGRSPALSFINLSLLLVAALALVASVPRLKWLPQDMPYGGCGFPDPEHEPAIILQVLPGGACAWNREVLAAGALPERLAAYCARTPHPGILIAGTELSRFGDLVAVVDAVQTADVPYAIETRMRQTLP